MGYHIHHAIICTSWDKEAILLAHNKANELFGTVSELISGEVNSYNSFLIAPDGSKEFWKLSEEYDKKRKEFKEFLKKSNIYIDWIELSFGGDEPELNTQIIEHKLLTN